MKLPTELLSSLEGVKGFSKEAFEAVHTSGEQITSVRINPRKWAIHSSELPIADCSLPIANKVPWSHFGFYLSERPSFTFDPLFHAGCYYVQEASSMFLEQALKQCVDLSQPLKVLDLCAAPGGKSTHLQSLLSEDSLLVSNEVIKNRAGILKQNIAKWGCHNVVVTNNDPQHFKKLEGFFDVLIVDAPCSGSGLFRKDEEAVNEWSKENVAFCCGRQKRIIADAFDSLKAGGILIYSTCSYLKEEDEDIADWLAEELKMKNVPLKLEEEWGVVETASAKTNSNGYRFFPDKVKGEGFYLACFRKEGDDNNVNYKVTKLERAGNREVEIIKPWIKPADFTFLKEHFIYALPSALVDAYSLIKKALNVQYAGVAIGEIMKERLVPDHALAVSNLVAEDVPRSELSYDDAIRYLQKGEINIDTAQKGWQLVHYQHYNLGWINALQNRVNNYYPKELRILKQRNDASFEK
jgi:NOL1/NOP2/sun family putative RNA methylase